jgi:ribulose-5-phosphate 4-epimerase/fuculose-1-phosphate aldolase
MSGILGHVSARCADDKVLLRHRGPDESGVIRTEPRAIRLVDLSGNPAEQSAGYDPPKELPIHTAIYLNRPEVGAVVHAHPRSAVLCGLAGLNPQPVVGAYNIPALHMALAGIPVFPRSVLITRAELADQMVEFMGQTQVCILRGHGIVAVGDTVEAATMAAVNLEELLHLTVSLAMLGAEPTPVPDEDLAELPDLGGHFNDILGWRALVSETLHQSSSGPRSESRFENALNDGSKWS